MKGEITFRHSHATLAYINRRCAELGLRVTSAKGRQYVICEAVLEADAIIGVRKFISKMNYLVLDNNGQPKACNLEDWAAWQKTDPDIGVDYTVVGQSAIGTKFVSILPHAAAPCWETNVIGGALHGLREVCSGNRDQAEQMHAAMVQRVTSAQKE